MTKSEFTGWTVGVPFGQSKPGAPSETMRIAVSRMNARSTSRQQPRIIRSYDGPGTTIAAALSLGRPPRLRAKRNGRSEIGTRSPKTRSPEMAKNLLRWTCDHRQKGLLSLLVRYLEEMLTAACASVREISSLGNDSARCASAGCHD